jgi:surface polysaccharide O-acyltransferase-like enzyme
VIAPNGELAQNWLRWLGWSTFLWGVLVVATHPAISSGAPSWWVLVVGTAWVLSCAASGLFVLAIFVRFGDTRTKLLDNLRDNAYGIYLIHYVFVIWLQYFLLRFALSAVAKGVIVFVGALALSWASVAGLRRASAIAHVI